MMAAPTLPLVSVDEYLNSSYELDREYVDGQLIERSMPTPAHALLQLILGEYLRRFRRQYRYAVLSEARTEIKRGSRYRIPDIEICVLPVSRGKVVDTVPLAVIEILSPEDRIRDVLARFHDYAWRGVSEIVLLDPEEYVAHRYLDGSLLKTSFQKLSMPDNREIPFNSDEIFAQLDAELDEE